MKKILLVSLPLFISFFCLAQKNTGTSYTTALGLKMYPGAVTLKHFLSNEKAIEGLWFVSQDGFRLTGLYEMHYPIESVEGLQWYVGGGAHMGVWSDSWKLRFPDRSAGMSLGVDGALGLDYKIKGSPLDISFDWQPVLHLVGYQSFESSVGGLAIRYCF